MSLDYTKPYSPGCRATESAALATLRAVCLALCVLALGATVVGQAPDQKPSLPSELKTLNFGFERKTVSRLELKQVNINNTTVPTEPYAYRAELSGAPERGNYYYAYEAEKTVQPYAVLRVRNDSAKTVESVDWEFTYPRFKGGKEEVNCRVRSRFKIPPGQVASLAKKLPQDGCSMRQVHDRGTILVSGVCGSRSNPKATGSYPLKAEIKRVKFSDGTIWQATP